MDTFQIGELTTDLTSMYIDYTGLDSYTNNIDTKTWVCVLRNKIIGHINAQYITGYEEPSYIKIKQINVNLKYRRHGIGNCLLSNVKDWAIEKKCCNLDIVVPVIDNITNRFVIKAGGASIAFIENHSQIYTFKVDSNDQV